jgi:hypothetical protein
MLLAAVVRLDMAMAIDGCGDWREMDLAASLEELKAPTRETKRRQSKGSVAGDECTGCWCVRLYRWHAEEGGHHRTSPPFHTNLNEDWIGGDEVVVRFRVGVNEGAIRLLMNAGNGRN